MTEQKPIEIFSIINDRPAQYLCDALSAPVKSVVHMYSKEKGYSYLFELANGKKFSGVSKNNHWEFTPEATKTPLDDIAQIKWGHLDPENPTQDIMYLTLKNGEVHKSLWSIGYAPDLLRATRKIDLDTLAQAKAQKDRGQRK